VRFESYSRAGLLVSRERRHSTDARGILARRFELSEVFDSENPRYVSESRGTASKVRESNYHYIILIIRN
jgi:hypothetical protein